MNGDTLGDDIRDAWTLLQVELRTYFRHLRADDRRLLAAVGMVVGFALLFPLAFAPEAVAFGRNLATGSIPVGTAGFVLWSVAGIAAYIGAAGGFNQSRVGRIGPLVRTSLPPVAVSLGRLTHRMTQSLAFVLPAGLILLGGVAVGGGPVTAIVVTAATVPLLFAGLAVGRVVGDLARYGNERLEVSLWVKALVLLGLIAVLFYATQLLLGAGTESSGPGTPALGPLVPGTPMQSYARAVFVPLGSTPAPAGVVVAALLVSAVPAGLYTALRLETYMLVNDIGSDAAGAVSAAKSYGVPRVFEVTPSTRVAWRYLLRTRRDPRMLVHLTPILFGLLAMAGSAVQNPDILRTVGPAAVVVLGTSLAGSAYCLNPLGDERDQLELLLTSRPSVGVFLRGRMVAGLVLGLVVALGIGTPLGLVEYGPVYAVGQSLLAVLLVTTSTGICVGLGAVVPKFERREQMSIERAHPSQWAMFGFLFGVLVVGTVGFGLLFVTLERLSPLVAVGWLVYVTVLALAAWGGYRYARTRLDAFTLDDI